MASRIVGQPGLLRAINLRAAFELVASQGPLTTTHVVQGTGLSKPTVSEVLRQLLELGLIRRVGRTRGQVGPSSQLYGVDPQSARVLGIDVGRHWLRVVAADLSGKVITRLDERVRRRNAYAMIDQLDRLVSRVSAEAGAGKRSVTVVGTPGVLRPGASHFVLAPLLPGWERPAVLTELLDRLPGPVIIENDVNLGAIAECSQGIGRGVGVFVLLWIGNGLGMAVVLDGKLHRGASGLAGEIGYLPIGSFDHIKRGRGMARWNAGAYERSVCAGAFLELAEEAGLGHVSTAAAVIDAARDGNAAACGVVSTIAERLAYGVAAVAASLDPELVILGGGIGAGAGHLLVEPMRRTLEQISPMQPRLAVSDLGSAAVLDGAVSEGVRRIKQDIFGADELAEVVM
jgi:predicted NBD/HSP70 family sugar kinase